MPKVFPYTQTQEAIFENVFKSEKVLVNHVIIVPGQVFPKHPTDAEVYAIIVKGILSVVLEEGESVNYSEGRAVYIPKGVLSELGNRTDEIVELFVVKTDWIGE